MDPVLMWSFLGVGLFAYTFAAVLAWRPLRLMRTGGRAEGEVTGNVEEVHSGGKGAARTYHFPQIVFTTAKGETISFRSMMGGRQPVPVGTRLPLLYDPAEPHTAIVKTGFMWLFPGLLVLFGSPFFLIGMSGLLGK